jgi:hypothetical protein
MSMVTHREVLEAVTVLATHGVEFGEIHRLLGSLPHIVRRTVEFCPDGERRSCRVFGVTWWKDASLYASYRVCLAHSWAEGPLGPLQESLPTAHRGDETAGERRIKPSYSGGRDGRSVTVVPELMSAGWAVTDEQRVVSSGCEAFRSHGVKVLADAAIWFDRLLSGFQPSTVLIGGRIPDTDEKAGHPNLSAMGIEMRTRKLGVPMDAYAGFASIERLVGALHVVADLHCPGEVFQADPFDIGDRRDMQHVHTKHAFDTGLRAATAEIARESR